MADLAAAPAWPAERAGSLAPRASAEVRMPTAGSRGVPRARPPPRRRGLRARSRAGRRRAEPYNRPLEVHTGTHIRLRLAWRFLLSGPGHQHLRA
eukprot:scaffold1504_cov417-Prasinococcus_capsulatus_cf.AAC.61